MKFWKIRFMTSCIQNVLKPHLSFLQNASTILIAYSGGLDSAVLLHSLLQFQTIKPKVKAIHVHHQLSFQADAWQLHCQKTAAHLRVPFTVLTVNAKSKRGESPEAAARCARYGALRALIQTGDYLLTAHHADDQLETVLLQLFRGAGLKGLSGMRVLAPFGSGFLLRPFLRLKRSELESYACSQGLTWIEDESNAFLGFDRNFLRHQVAPILKARWPEISTTVSRASRHCLAADEFITEEARELLQKVLKPTSNTLSVTSLQKLSPAAQPLVLRQWILERGFLLPSEKKLGQVLKTVLLAGRDRIPCVRWKGAEIRRYRDDLYLMQPLSSPDIREIVAWNPNESLFIPSLGITITKIDFEKSGVNFSRLTGPFTIRFRQGGEKCLLAGRTHHTSLKHLFQTLGVPPWLRDRIPLLCEGAEVVGVLYH